jgi:cytochrome c556
MDMQGALAGDMKRAVDAKADVKPFKNAAIGIGKWGKAIPAMYPEDSLQGTFRGTTKALPAIGKDRAGFQKAAADLSAAAQKLQAAAEAGDEAGFAAGFQALGQACTGCHNQFRAK